MSGGITIDDVTLCIEVLRRWIRVTRQAEKMLLALAPRRSGDQVSRLAEMILMQRYGAAQQPEELPVVSDAELEEKLEALRAKLQGEKNKSRQQA